MLLIIATMVVTTSVFNEVPMASTGTSMMRKIYYKDGLVVNADNKFDEPLTVRTEDGRLLLKRSLIAETARLADEKRAKEERVKKEEEQRLIEEEARRIEVENQRRLEEEARLAALTPNFNPHNLTEPSNLNFDKAYAMLEGSALQSAAAAYVYAEEVYGVNAIFLMALTSFESGHGRSSLAMSRNNIGGIKGGNGDWAYFSDWGECIMHMADFLSELYLREDGVYYSGYSIWGVNIKYCQDDSDWSGMIIDIANSLMSKI